MIIIATITIASVATAWITMYYLTHWQRTNLLTIRNVISIGVMQDTLTKRALRTIEAYHDPARSSSETFAQVFNRVNPRISPASNVLDTLFYFENHKVTQLIYVESITDSEVTVVGRDEMSRSQESFFQMQKMNIVKPMITLHLSAKGATYEIEH